MIRKLLNELKMFWAFHKYELLEMQALQDRCSLIPHYVGVVESYRLNQIAATEEEKKEAQRLIKAYEASLQEKTNFYERKYDRKGIRISKRSPWKSIKCWLAVWVYEQREQERLIFMARHKAAEEIYQAECYRYYRAATVELKKELKIRVREAAKIVDREGGFNGKYVRM